MKTKYFLVRSEMIDGCEHINALTSFDKQEDAMRALHTFAAIIDRAVCFQEGTEYGGEPAIWAWTVTDESGATYYIVEEYVDEEGNIIDIFEL